MRKWLIFFVMLAMGLGAATAGAATRLRLATTTSTENSGLLYVLIPPFEKQTGIKVDVISVGTGKALKLGQRCDVDIVMVHAPAREIAYVKKGYGVDRRAVMHNYFAIAGPPNDPAQVAQAKSLTDALKRIVQHKARFISRGDDSGTHIKERSLWKAAGLKTDWPGYREAGQGMGAVLNMASQLGAYTLTDTGTFLKYKSAGKLNLKLLFMKDKLLANPYHVMMVNPARCPKVKVKAAKAFMDFLVSPRGQAIIKKYRAAGKQLFWPDVVK